MDVETGLTTGQASTEFYRDDFRVLSCAVSWYEGADLCNLFVEGESDSLELIKYLDSNNVKVIAHNVGFEMGVCFSRFPGTRLTWYADTMRLAQVADGGGAIEYGSPEELSLDEEITGKSEFRRGFGLEACVSRWLPAQYHNHKTPYYTYLRDTHGVRKGQEGANLTLLPPDMLAAYNTADTDVTLLLYTSLVKFLEGQRYDWSFDHYLYLAVAQKITESKIRGIRVDRNHLENAVIAITNDLQAMMDQFRSTYINEITAIEQENLNLIWAQRKTEKGQTRAWEQALETPELHQFNVNSTAHKKRLFVDKLGIEPKFSTEKGAPSFARHLLGQWGDGGRILSTRGTLAIARSQAESILTMSEYDNRYHVDLRAAGTTTGRFAGSGGLNIQGMSRKEPRLMRGLVADPGHVFVSVDLAAGEPTITTHFSQDPYYRSATFDMVGKAPYYDSQGVLMIDDIYLMGMSVSPMGQALMYETFGQRFGDFTFTEQWLRDPEVIKTRLKRERAFHKILILGLGYAMGPKHMVESAFKAGYELSLKQAKAFFKAYWNLFSEVRNLATALEAQFNAQGYLENPFGYRLVPDPSYKSLNYFIQSSVSGLINALCVKFFTVCPVAQFVTVIHDEIIFQVPESHLSEAKVLFDKSVESLNADLNWSVNVRCGWKPGKDFYEAK